MQRNAMKIKLVVASILFGLATSLHAAPPPPIPAKPAALADFKVGDRVGARYGYLPEMLKDPENPDLKNFTPAVITRLQDGSTLVTPEHIHIMRLP
jgi:hypothetical protein